MAADMLTRRVSGCLNRTATAGTAITVLIQGIAGFFARLSRLLYTPAGTSHVLTLLKPVTRSSVAAAAAAGQPVISLPTNAVAVNDLVVVQLADGRQQFAQVSSKAAPAGGLEACTLNANLAAAVNLNGRVWNLKTVAAATEKFALATGGQRTVGNNSLDGALAGGDATGDPIVIYVDNVTAAGNLDEAQWCWTDETVAPSSFG